MTEGTSSRAALRTAALSGVRWYTLARVAVEVVAFGASIVLARLISPAEFGQAVLVIVVLAISGSLFAEGITTPLVQRRTIGPTQLRAMTTVALVTGVVSSILVLVGVAPLVEQLAGADSGRLMELAAPVLAIQGISAVPRSKLQRALRFGVLGPVDASAPLVQAVTSVALATAGLGVEAIVFGAFAGAVAEALLLVVFGGLPRPGWQPRVMRELMAFGAASAAASVVYTAGRNAQYAVLAGRLGVEELGYFWRAYQLGTEYQSKVSGIMLRLALPLYSRTETLADIRAIRGRVVRVHALAVLPPLVALAVTAPVLVPALYGPAWEPAVLPTQILAFAGVAHVINSGTGPLLVAVGRPAALLGVNVVFAVLLLAATWFAAPAGLLGVSLAVVAVLFLNVLVSQRLLVQRYVGIPARDVAAELVPPAVGCGALALTTGAAQAVLLEAGVPGLLNLLVSVALGAAVYCLVVRRAFPGEWSDLVRLLRGVRGRDATEPSAVAATPALER